MSQPKTSGIQTAADGQAYIPASKRADGSTRKEIRVRPGYKPPEDVEKYVNRSAEAWRSRADGGVPGAEPLEDNKPEGAEKSKNAKRREAARRKKELENEQSIDAVEDSVAKLNVQNGNSNAGEASAVGSQMDDQMSEVVAEQQKKIRNQLKKLKAVRELKAKRSAGEKLSADQLIKISKETELIKDLTKLGYDGPEVNPSSMAEASEP